MQQQELIKKETLSVQERGVSCVYFYGVNLGGDRYNGFIKSGELITQFGRSWMPNYQRDRVLTASKIANLIKIFKSRAPIDSIKINFIGDIEREGDSAILEGKFHVIDGQQRLYALKDSGVNDLNIPVELYVNLSMDQEVKLFHQYNREGTKLTFDDLAKSLVGNGGDLIRKLLRDNGSKLPIKIVCNNSKVGLTLSKVCPLLHLIYSKLVKKERVTRPLTGKRLQMFLQKEIVEMDLYMIEFALTNLLKKYQEVFGGYDLKSSAYCRSWFLATCHVFIDFFLGDDGKFDFQKFEKKVEQLPVMFKNSHIKELLSIGDTVSSVQIYDAIVERFNHKLKAGHLPHRRSGIKVSSEDTV